MATPEDRSVFSWNAPDLWRGEYDLTQPDLLFFAEDAFGMQFGVSPAGVSLLDPETGKLGQEHRSVSEWASGVIDEPAEQTAYPSLEEWEASNQPLAHGDRLLPVQPFVIGGEFDAENLYALDAAEGMRVRARIAEQLRDLPDGTQVRLTTRPDQTE